MVPPHTRKLAAPIELAWVAVGPERWEAQATPRHDYSRLELSIVVPGRGVVATTVRADGKAGESGVVTWRADLPLDEPPRAVARIVVHGEVLGRTLAAPGGKAGLPARKAGRHDRDADLVILPAAGQGQD